jgi:hypothetical protein
MNVVAREAPTSCSVRGGRVESASEWPAERENEGEGPEQGSRGGDGDSVTDAADAAGGDDDSDVDVSDGEAGEAGDGERVEAVERSRAAER